MTTCDKILPRLTAYLDGELAIDHGSVVRGHLRECAACRQSARDEAALRDSLRTLAPVDPPASLWAGVQAQLAAAEVADARKPRWRRAIGRWTRIASSLSFGIPSLPQLAAGGALAVVAAATLYWRAHQGDEPSDRIAAITAPVSVVHEVAPPPPPVLAAGDVTADLVAEPGRVTDSYGQVIEELMQLATAARPAWSDDRRAAFDAKLVALHDGIAHASPGHLQQRAQRSLIRYLQGAIVRDDVVLASGGPR